MSPSASHPDRKLIAVVILLAFVLTVDVVALFWRSEFGRGAIVATLLAAWPLYFGLRSLGTKRSQGIVAASLLGVFQIALVILLYQGS